MRVHAEPFEGEALIARMLPSHEERRARWIAWARGGCAATLILREHATVDQEYEDPITGMVAARGRRADGMAVRAFVFPPLDYRLPREVMR
jgi:hypothetical protein